MSTGVGTACGLLWVLSVEEEGLICESLAKKLDMSGRRAEDEEDLLRWFCESCGEMLYDANFQLVDLGKQLKPIIEQFWADEKLRTCKKCGHVMAAPAPAAPAK